MADATLTTILWRDIPAQVTAKEGRNTHRIELSARFQQAIDRAAMAAGKIGTDEYLEDWRRETAACTGDIQEAASAEAVRLEAAFPLRVLNEYVANYGYTPPEGES